MKKPVIEFKNVTFQHYTQARPTLKNINLTINQGEKVLIVGPSGSGKTTLGNLINGLIPHALKGDLTGEVMVDGINVKTADLFELSLHVGTVLQDPDTQFVALTAAEDIAFALENDAVNQKDMRKKVNYWANELNVTNDQLIQNPQTLSGGQKQRNAMAGVLVDEGKILLFDEPLAALDPAAGAKSMKLIEKLHKALNMTVIIIEHRIEDVLTSSVDRLIVLDNGQIVADDTPNNILKTDILKNSGLREPLYVEALKAAGVSLNSVENLDDVLKIDAPNLIDDLKKLENTIHKNVIKNNNSNLLKIEKISFNYLNGKQIFKNFSLDITSGEMLAIVGKNGVGKTTLSQLITGFEKNSTGKITLNGQNLARLSIKERADYIGYVMQDPNHMISKAMIYDEVALGLVLRGVNENEIKQRVEKVLRICGLYPFRNWPISALSFGQKKRVTIASILVLEPKIIILDEPTAGQDWKHYTEMMQFLKNLNQQTKITLIFITHDMHLMLEYATRAIALGENKILADATPAEILADNEIIKAASLTQNSLYKLANRFSLDPVSFTNEIIKYELGTYTDE